MKRSSITRIALAASLIAWAALSCAAAETTSSKPMPVSDVPVVDAKASASATSATTEIRDCDYCDYRPVCRNLDRTVAASKKKLERALHPGLSAMRELRG